MHKATRTHEFCYGHRVFNHEGKCAHLHGHAGVVSFTCVKETGGLDDVGRAIDFSVMKTTLCQWLEENWDHRMLLWEGDPFLEKIRSIDSAVVALPINPTAENLAHYLLFTVGPAVLKGTGARLIAVNFAETGKCSASVEDR